MNHIDQLLAVIEQDWTEAERALRARREPAGPGADGYWWCVPESATAVDPMIRRAVSVELVRVSSVRRFHPMPYLGWFVHEDRPHAAYAKRWGCRDWPAWAASDAYVWHVDPDGCVVWLSTLIALEDVPRAVADAVAALASART